MALHEFPSNIQPPVYPFGNKLENPAMASAMENGTVVSRPRFTRLRETFSLKWTALPAAEYELLRSFWKNTVLGGSDKFTWTYPAIPGDAYSGRVFTVRFTGEMSFDLVSQGYYSGNITLQEV